MSYWNYNGLNVAVRARKGIIKIKSKMEEVKEIELLEYNDSEYSRRLGEITYLMKSKYSNLDDERNSYILGEYIKLRLSKYVNENETYKFVRVAVIKQNIPRNYIACRIEVYFYYNQQDYDFNNYATVANVGLYELFSNCSSISINNFRGLGNKFTNTYMKILEDICDICNYSTILYTCSHSETDRSVFEYLKNNKDWKVIKEFKNKRNGHIISYYTKDL